MEWMIIIMITTNGVLSCIYNLNRYSIVIISRAFIIYIQLLYYIARAF